MSHAMAYGLSLVGLLWYLTMCGVSLLGSIVARRRYRLRVHLPLCQLSDAPGVSILRPLKGLDTNLYENLESSFKQEYPKFEIIFSVADENDESLPIVYTLINRYPNVLTTVIIGEEVVGVNPKVNNLVRPFQRAKYDIVWVVDSGIMAAPWTLARSVESLTSSKIPRVGLVHHVPFAVVSKAKVGSQLEAAFLNTNHAKMYIAINAVGIESCVVGKSNLYRRSDLDMVNGCLLPAQPQIRRLNEPAAGYGLPAFSRFLAEDNMIASALWHELGLEHDLSCDVARNIIGNMSFSDYAWRRVRWIRVRKHMALVATLVEPYTESVVLCIIGSLSCRALLGVPLWLFAIFHFLLWLSIDLDVYVSIGGHETKENNLSFVLAWLGREILAFPIWLIAIVGNEVTWRGENYRVLRNGEARISSARREL